MPTLPLESVKWLYWIRIAESLIHFSAFAEQAPVLFVQVDAHTAETKSWFGSAPKIEYGVTKCEASFSAFVAF